MDTLVQSLIRYTRVQEIVGDVIRLYASGVALGDKNWNYSPPGSAEYQKYKSEIELAAAQQASGS
jgi:hypothetical protein